MMQRKSITEIETTDSVTTQWQGHLRGLDSARGHAAAQSGWTRPQRLRLQHRWVEVEKVGFPSEGGSI